MWRISELPHRICGQWIKLQRWDTVFHGDVCVLLDALAMIQSTHIHHTETYVNTKTHQMIFFLSALVFGPLVSPLVTPVEYPRISPNSDTQVSRDRYKKGPSQWGMSGSKHTPVCLWPSLTWTRHMQNILSPKETPPLMSSCSMPVGCLPRQEGQILALILRRSSERSVPLEHLDWPMRLFSTTWVHPSSVWISRQKTP